MENVHTAIAWYQTKIGSYDKQLWEQSVEKKLQKQPPFVLHGVPRKNVRLKTEYIDVDLIRGSMFSKTKPQVPWVYVTRKAIARVLFFPFYFNWWVHQTSKKLYVVLLVLYILQVFTVLVYLGNFDKMEDELCFTEVILPIILMFLLCLIHSQTVLAHINHKPPKHNKNISGVTRKPRPKKPSHRTRSSDNNSTCQDDDGNVEATRASKRQMLNQHFSGVGESHSVSQVSHSSIQKNLEPVIPSSIDMEGSLMSCSVSDYDLKPAIKSSQNDISPSASSALRGHRERMMKNDGHQLLDRHRSSNSRKPSRLLWGKEDINTDNVYGKWGDRTQNSAQTIQKSGCSYNLLDNLPNLLTVEKVFHDVHEENQNEERMESQTERGSYNINCPFTNSKYTNLCTCSEGKSSSPDTADHNFCVKCASRIIRSNVELRMCHCVNGSRVTCCGNDITRHVVICGDRDCSDIPKRVNDNDVLNAGIPPSYKINSNPCSTSSVSQEDLKRGILLPRNKDLVITCHQQCHSPQDACTCFSGGELSQHQAACGASIQSPSSPDSLTVCSAGCDIGKVHSLIQPSFVEREINTLHVEGVTETLPFEGATDNLPCQGLTDNLPFEGTTHISNVVSKPNPLTAQDSNYSAINNPMVGVVTDNSSPCTGTHELHSYLRPHDNKSSASCSTIGVKDVDSISVNTVGTDLSCSGQNQRGFAADSSGCDAHMLASIPCQTLQNLSSEITANSSNPLVDNAKIDKHQDFEYLINSKKCIERNLSEISKSANIVPQDLSQPVNISSMLVPGVCNCGRGKTSVAIQQEHVSSGSSSKLQQFSELFMQEILNEDTLREMSCSSLLAHSDLDNSSSSASRLSSVSTASSSSSCTPLFTTSSAVTPQESTPYFCQQHLQCSQGRHEDDVADNHDLHVKFHDSFDDDKNDPFEESLERINLSEEERHSDDLSNYNPSDSDVDSDGSVNEDIHIRFGDKWKRLRFKELADEDECAEKLLPTKINKGILSGAGVIKPGMPAAAKKGPTLTKNGYSSNGGGPRSVIEVLARKPSPLKDLTIGRKSNNNTPVTNSSGSDKEQSESRSQLRRRRRISGTPYEQPEPSRGRNIPSSLGLRPSDAKMRQISSSENEIGGVNTAEESNKATVSSEEWEDRIQSDETTSSAYSSNTEVDHDGKVEDEGEERTEYTTNTFHVINLLQPQNGSPTTTGNITTQPDRVPCMIWEGNECKKIDLTALDIGWAIIDKVDILPESSDYFLIGLLFSLIICMVPLVFRVYANKDLTGSEDLLSWSGLVTKLTEMSALVINSYSWRQYLLMVNGIFQRFFLSLIFFFLLSVADRTFKQRLLYAKHFSYLTTSRRARKFAMPHFRLNKVRNIKIWLSLRSYLKRRGPQRSVDVIVSASFLVTVSMACLISIQMLKDTESFLDYLCNWELLVWCIALSVFLMRFMTLGLKINKKYRNLSVLITEQINLYLQMEKKPHKKEELILANNVLRLAEDLLKELESPFKISGFSANPLIYNITRIVVLSAFSAVLTEILGFKLKLHKIKLKG